MMQDFRTHIQDKMAEFEFELPMENNYCDYDESASASAITASSEGLLAQIRKRDRKFDGNLASRYNGDQSYFTNIETRNAQTVSHKQRHRPIFQLFADLCFALLVLAITLVTLIYWYRDGVLNPPDGSTPDTLKKLIEENFFLFVAHIFIPIFFFLKFYVGMIWYRCFAEGNLV